MWVDLGALQEDLEEVFEQYYADDPRKPEMRVNSKSLSVFKQGILDHEYDSLWVNSDGMVELHWSMPRCFVIINILKKHGLYKPQEDKADDES